MFWLACSLLMVATVAHGFQQETNAIDPEREKDVYAIYSLMLTNPKTSHGSNERYLIRATTVPGTPRGACVRPPKEREAEFGEVLTDFDQRSDTARQLERKLLLQKPYVLLTADQANQFATERSLNPNRPKTRDELFRGVTDLFSFSDVYFNRRRTLALTAISSWCGSLCALYQWKVFEKTDSGNWKELDWSTCITVARIY
jgi:hypothetical protein